MAVRWSIPSRPLRGCARRGVGGGAQSAFPANTTTPRLSASLSASTVRSGPRWSRAPDPAPLALDEEPDDGFPAVPGVANRDQTAVSRGLVGISPDVVAHPDAPLAHKLHRTNHQQSREEKTEASSYLDAGHRQRVRWSRGHHITVPVNLIPALGLSKQPGPPQSPTSVPVPTALNRPPNRVNPSQLRSRHLDTFSAQGSGVHQSGSTSGLRLFRLSLRAEGGPGERLSGPGRPAAPPTVARRRGRRCR